MICGIFTRNNVNQIVSFELTGHAEAGPYGSDIVCAAVSALAISTINGINVLAEFTPLVEVNDVEGGYLYMEMLKDVTTEQNHVAAILLENLLLGLQSIQEEHSEFIHIKTKQTEGGADS